MTIITWIKNIFTKKQADVIAIDVSWSKQNTLNAIQAHQSGGKLILTAGTFTMPDPFIRNELGGTIRHVIRSDALRTTDCMPNTNKAISYRFDDEPIIEYEVEGSWYTEEEYQRLLKLKAFL